MDPATLLILKLGVGAALPLILKMKQGDAEAIAEARRLVKEPTLYFEDE